MRIRCESNLRLNGGAAVLLLIATLASAQKVDTAIPLSELESLKLNALDKDMVNLGLKMDKLESQMRPLRMDMENLKAEWQATRNQRLALEESVLAEHYLNPQEYGIDLPTNSIFKVDPPTPRPTP